MKKGLLILNLGTPDKPKLFSVARYLCEFLTDKRVVDLPWLLRYLLVCGVIIPLRAKSSTKAYQTIWDANGSPLRFHTQNLQEKLQAKLGNDWLVCAAMRYGKPSIKQALNSLSVCSSITVLPLYPQYASASTGSSLEAVLFQIAKKTVIPAVNVIPDFYDHSAYLQAMADQIRPYIQNTEFIIFSYHGIPVRQLLQAGCKTVCSGECKSISVENAFCYRAQCYSTSLALTDLLQLETKQHTTAFQSRLGKTPWIEPYFDKILPDLIARGFKNITVCCPSFVADCLETIEEIGIRAQERWSELGGNKLTLVPSLNSNQQWVDAIAKIVVAN